MTCVEGERRACAGKGHPSSALALWLDDVGGSVIKPVGSLVKAEERECRMSRSPLGDLGKSLVESQ